MDFLIRILSFFILFLDTGEKSAYNRRKQGGEQNAGI